MASGMGCASAFVCPYHGWTYGIDGRLARVQHERGFPGLDKSAHGLVPVLAQERSGIVWITQSGQPSGHDPGEGLPDLIAADQDLIDTHDNEVDANWKVSIEGSIEGYHIRFGHPETFYPYGYDNLNVVDLFMLKGRCVARLSVSPNDEDAENAMIEIGRELAAAIPLDGSAPAADEDLVALVPRPEDLDGWEEDVTDQIEGPWLVTTEAFAWINGAAAPFEDNGFEAVAGEAYLHDTEGWQLDLALVNQGSFEGAEAAFGAAGWDTGVQIE